MPGPATGELFAGCRLEEIVDDGDVATVFRARDDEGSGETVAVRVLRIGTMDDLELSRRFSGVMRASAIHHPNIVREYRTGEDQGFPYIVSEFVDGPSLRAVLRDRGRLDPPLAGAIVSQIADALEVVHAGGRIHRAVAPVAVLLKADLSHPHALLSDFVMSRAPSEDGATQIGAVVGIGPYGAPEIMLGGAIDGRADVYSLGCVLFESLTGQTPFPDTSFASIVRRTSEPPPSVLEAAPDLDPRWHEVLECALATEPEDRFGSAASFGAAVDRVAGGPGTG